VVARLAAGFQAADLLLLKEVYQFGYGGFLDPKFFLTRM